MALSTRQRWMLYGLAGLLTAAAMLAVSPQEEADTVTPVVRPARRVPSPSPVAAVLSLPERPFSAAGRSPFGEQAALTPAAAAAAAAQAAGPTAATPSPPPIATAIALPFSFLGRWTEAGVITVFLSSGGRSLPAVAGRHVTPDYLVEAVGEREMQLRHVPTGMRHTLALVAGGNAAAAAPTGTPAAQADTEEQN